MPRPSSIVLSALLLLTGACAAPGITSLEDCETLSCVQFALAFEAHQQCTQDLFRHDRVSRAEQARINATYRYPLTNSQTYFDLSRSGMNGPTPDEWCRHFVAQRGNRALSLR